MDNRKKKMVLSLSITLVFVFCIYILLKETYSTNEGLVDEFITRNISELNSVLTTKTDNSNPYFLKEILDENGNVPAYNYYTSTEKQLPSRSIKELKAYDDKIFLGLGDWDANTGPAKILYYDTKTEKIVSSGTIADEAVEGFNIIDGKIYTTGTDPRANWGYGSYYVYNNETNKWEQFQKQNGWIHVFEIEKYKDKFFMCGSVNSTKFTPVQVSYDNGETFQNVKIYDKNGEELVVTNSLRFYAFEHYNDNFYAYTYDTKTITDENGESKTVGLESNGLYKYDEDSNSFNFVRKFGYKATGNGLSESIRYNLIHFRSNVEFNDYFIYVSGNYLYKFSDSDNFESYSVLDVDSDRYIQDVAVHDDTLYMLAYRYNEDKSFSTRIYSTKDLETFDLVYESNIDTFPFSIEYHNDSIYIGTRYYAKSKDYIDYNSGLKENSETGSLYKIDLNKFTDKLTLDENNRKIDILADATNYSVDYNISDNNYVFETILTFNKNMSERQWEREFNKLKNLNLIYSVVDNKNSFDLDKSTNYFNNVYENNISSLNTGSNALEFAYNVFSDKLNINDERFDLTIELINKNETEYQYKVVLDVLVLDDSIFSSKYYVDLENNYIYVGKDNDINIIKDNIEYDENVNVDIDLNTNKISINFGEKLLKEYSIIKYINNLFIDDNNLYVSNLEVNDILSNFSVINAEPRVNNGKLEIMKNDKTLEQFNLLYIRFGNLKVANKIITINEIVSYSEIIKNITKSDSISYKVFVNEKEINSGNIKNATLKVYYKNQVIEEFDIIGGYLEFDPSISVNENKKKLYIDEANIELNEIIKKVNTNGNISLYNKFGNKITDDSLISTGDTIIIKIGNNTYEYKVIIIGDINGDGIINIDDIDVLVNHVYNNKNIDEFYLEAADIDKNNVYELQDIMKIAKRIYKEVN